MMLLNYCQNTCSAGKLRLRDFEKTGSTASVTKKRSCITRKMSILGGIFMQPDVSRELDEDLFGSNDSFLCLIVSREIKWSITAERSWVG